MLSITSSSFGNGDRIGRSHTADGADLAPALAFGGVPAGTKSLVLVIEDPDAPDPAAPQKIFAHWIVYNLPPSLAGLPLGARRADLPGGAKLGRNDFGNHDYQGPAPPVGRHRYFFRLFAVDITLADALGTPDRAAVMRTIQGHILEEAELMGTYERAASYAQSSPA